MELLAFGLIMLSIGMLLGACLGNFTAHSDNEKDTP